MKISAAVRLFVLLAACSTPMQAQVLADPLSEPRALVARGLPAEAQKIVDEYLRSNPESADGRYLRAEILFREKKPKESLSEFTEGAKGRRPTAREFGMIASNYVLLADYVDADRWFVEATIEAPGDATYWYLLGRTRYKETNYEAAVKSFDHALALRPNYVEAQNNRGLALSALLHKDAAMQAFQQAIDWQGTTGTDAQPYFNLGTMLVQQNELPKGVALLKTAVALFPANPSMHEELGKAYLAQGDLESAQHEFETAVALSPDTSTLHFRLGQIYKKQKLADRAQREFAICARLLGTHSSSETPNPFGPETPEIK